MRDAERQCGFVNGVRCRFTETHTPRGALTTTRSAESVNTRAGLYAHAYAYMRALMRHTATRVPLRERVLRVGINQSVH